MLHSEGRFSGVRHGDDLRTIVRLRLHEFLVRGFGGDCVRTDFRGGTCLLHVQRFLRAGHKDDEVFSGSGLQTVVSTCADFPLYLKSCSHILADITFLFTSSTVCADRYMFEEEGIYLRRLEKLSNETIKPKNDSRKLELSDH